MSKAKILTLFVSFLSVSLSAGCNTWDCTPPSSCERECYFYAGGEALWWTVCQTNLDFGVDASNHRDQHYLEYEWKLGGRGWLGFDFGQGWDLRGVYTWFKDSASGEISGEHYPLLLRPTENMGTALQSHGSNDLHYQVADLIIGRRIHFCCDTFMMEPYIGTRAIQLDQELKVSYDGSDFVMFDSELKAIGLHLGLDLDYDFCGCLGFYGGFGGSILYGKGDHEQKQFTDIETEYAIHDELYNTIPGYHLKAGMLWHLCRSRCLNVVLRGGYEFSHWFNTPQVRRFYDSDHQGVSSSINDGEITFHGATLSLTILF